MATFQLSAAPRSGQEPDQAAAGQRFYLPELDVLRFFAFLAVFLFHAPPLGHRGHSFVDDLATIGIFGVDLFFALSAYLITRLLLREREATGRIDIKSFYIRRLLRIWPLY